MALGNNTLRLKKPLSVWQGYFCSKLIAFLEQNLKELRYNIYILHVSNQANLFFFLAEEETSYGQDYLMCKITEENLLDLECLDEEGNLLYGITIYFVI